MTVFEYYAGAASRRGIDVGVEDLINAIDNEPLKKIVSDIYYKEKPKPLARSQSYEDAVNEEGAPPLKKSPLKTQKVRKLLAACANLDGSSRA